MKQRMREFSNNMHFEKAQEIKEKIAALENYQSKSTIVNPKINNVDVFTIISENEFKGIRATGMSNRDVPARPVKLENTSANE